MKRSLKLLSLSVMAATSLAVSAPAISGAHGNGPSISSKVVLSNLENPWDMAILDDGSMFFTEKCKGLSVRLPSGDVNPLYGMGGSSGYPSTGDDLFCEGQAGMMGVAIDPDFENNRRIYVMSTSNMHGDGSNLVMRFEVNDDMTGVMNRTDIVSDIQYKPVATDHPFGGPGAHNGGRLRFDQEGSLWVTTGDRHKGDVPQSPTLIGGKVLRIDTDGNAHPDNNPPEGFDKRIYTYGHRNVQGIDFRPADGRPFVAEHGPWHSDEITALVNGGNGGWDPRPNIAGRGDCPDQYCGYMPNQMDAMEPAERAAFMPMSDTRFEDLMPPAWNNNGLSQGTGSAAFLGEEWGAWSGRLAVGIMGIGYGGTPVGQRIDIIDLTDDGLGIKSIQRMPLGVSQRFRGLATGPDGTLYAAVDEGEIHAISPQ